MHPQAEKATPADFPRDYALGAVSGAQPKLLVRKAATGFVSGLTADELYARYEACYDLVNQLAVYCSRKLDERPEWTASELLEKVQASLRARADWDFSESEVRWMMEQLWLRMN
jgi:hypothetical protein